MLSQELMGLLALGILWVNGLLVIAVAFKQLRVVRETGARFRRASREGRLVAGVVKEGEPLAIRHVAQLGRAVTSGGAPRILFTDGPQSFEVLGGAVETAEGVVRVAPAQPGLSEVWVAPERAAEARACPSVELFEEAYGEASKYKGYARELEVAIRAGDRVWILGDRDQGELRPSETEPLVVSMVEPLLWVSEKTFLLVAFIAGASLALCAVTALALQQPWFGTLSTIGGALCVAYFLGVPPIGTAVRDAVRTPARQPLGGTWTKA